MPGRSDTVPGRQQAVAPEPVRPFGSDVIAVFGVLTGPG